MFVQFYPMSDLASQGGVDVKQVNNDARSDGVCKILGFGFTLIFLWCDI